MVAAAFTQQMIFRGQANGRVMHVAQTVSDVAGGFSVMPDGNGFLQLPSDQAYSIIDVIVETGGTDTKFQDVYANGLSTGIRLTNKANLNTSNFRQFQNAPVAFKPGALLRFKQASS